MRRSRILYVEQNNDGTTGGSHFCLLDAVRRLDRSRFEPFVLFYEENDLIDEFRRLCPTFVVPMTRGLDFTSKLPCPLDRYCCLTRVAQKSINLFRSILPGYVKKARFLRGHKVDLVHLNNAANCGYDWIVACRAAGVPCITHNRGRIRLSHSDRFFARRFDCIVSIAGFLREELARQGIEPGERSVVINDGIDPDEIVSRVRRTPAETRRDLGLPQDGPLIGIVGNVREWKGQLIVARAVHLLTDAHPSLRCLVVGGVSATRSADRDYLRSIEAFIAGHGLGGRVLILGYRTDVPDLVRSLDILVHASVSPEPFGRVILEGMALGRPVIATNIGGPLEIIEDGVSGFLVPPDDPPALAGAIGALLEDAALRERIARAGSRRASECFHMDRCIGRLHDLYDQLLGDGPA